MVSPFRYFTVLMSSEERLIQESKVSGERAIARAWLGSKRIFFASPRYSPVRRYRSLGIAPPSGRKYTLSPSILKNPRKKSMDVIFRKSWTGRGREILFSFAVLSSAASPFFL